MVHSHNMTPALLHDMTWGDVSRVMTWHDMLSFAEEDDCLKHMFTNYVKIYATLAHHYLLIRVTSQIRLHFRWHCFTIPWMARSLSPCQCHLHGQLRQASEKDTSLFQDGHPPGSLQCWCWEDKHLHHTRLRIHDRERIKTISSSRISESRECLWSRQ